MRQLLKIMLAFGVVSFVGCQQTQEADEPEEADKTVIERETTVEPADEPDVDMDVEIKEEEPGGGAAGEVEMNQPEQNEGASGEVQVEEGAASGEVKVQEFKPAEEGQAQQP